MRDAWIFFSSLCFAKPTPRPTPIYLSVVQPKKFRYENALIELKLLDLGVAWLGLLQGVGIREPVRWCKSNRMFAIPPPTNGRLKMERLTGSKMGPSSPLTNYHMYHSRFPTFKPHGLGGRPKQQLIMIPSLTKINFEKKNSRF